MHLAKKIHTRGLPFLNLSALVALLTLLAHLASYERLDAGNGASENETYAGDGRQRQLVVKWRFQSSLCISLWPSYV